MIAFFVQSYELHQAKAELKRLYRETGRLIIENESEISLIRTLDSSEGRWKWRIYAPPGVRFDICTSTSDIPQDGVGEGSISSDHNFGFHKEGVVVSVQKSESGRLTVCVDGEPMVGSKMDSLPPSFVTEFSMDFSAGLNQENHNLYSPIVLKKFRIIEKGCDTSAPSKYGFMVWLVPKRVSKSNNGTKSGSE